MKFDIYHCIHTHLSERQTVRTFDVCLARPKICLTDIVRPHMAQLMIDTSVNQFCKIWPSADCPQESFIFKTLRTLIFLSNPVEASEFLLGFICNCFKLLHNCEDLFHFYSLSTVHSYDPDHIHFTSHLDQVETWNFFSENEQKPLFSELICIEFGTWKVPHNVECRLSWTLAIWLIFHAHWFSLTCLQRKEASSLAKIWWIQISPKINVDTGAQGRQLLFSLYEQLCVAQYGDSQQILI